MEGGNDRVDAGEVNVIYFADEGGSWQVEIDWDRVLPARFRVLPVSVEPVEYAQRIGAVLKRHYSHGRIKMLAMARRIATPAQREVLPKF